VTSSIGGEDADERPCVWTSAAIGKKPTFALQQINNFAA
jgi:hypothetical protein